jgi:D-glycero-D-manno-heptose 1,7-bisphosphate phosphatase
MKTPRQAVILCGGLGSRLYPLTKTLPKPMAPVMGKPFLEYLFVQLEEQGINHFFLLTGYLGNIIKEYFGNGSKWGWVIEYSHGPDQWDTGRRLWESRSRLDNRFLLMYSDNFIQFNLKKLVKLFQQEDIAVRLILAPKEKGNISVSDDGKILEYKKDRVGKNLNYVEVGYMIVDRDYIFSLYSDNKSSPDISFTNIIESLVNNSQIAGLVVNDPYHSISDKQRLELMRKYLKPKKIILIDRDGVINRKAPKGQYITKWEEFEFIYDTVKCMKKLAKKGFSFIVVTNQAGVARGMVCEKELNNIHKSMISRLKNKSIIIHDVYICPHHWDQCCNCRKPEPGLFFQISKKYKLRMDKTLYIGDDIRDVEAAYNAGCGSVLVSSKDDVSVINKPRWSINVNKLSDALLEIETFMGIA